MDREDRTIYKEVETIDMDINSYQVIFLGAKNDKNSVIIKKYLEEISRPLKGLRVVDFKMVEVTVVPTTAIDLGVQNVPAVLIINGCYHQIIESLLLDQMKNIIKTNINQLYEVANIISDRIKEVIHHPKRLIVFIKGTSTAPKCKFTRTLVELLKSQNVDFGYVDILNELEFRFSMKVYSQWPTFPQIYLDGEFLGGLDVFMQVFKDPSFVEKLPKQDDTHVPEGIH